MQLTKNPVYIIKNDPQKIRYHAEINRERTDETLKLTFNLVSVEKNNIDGNVKYFADNVLWHQILEVK